MKTVKRTVGEVMDSSDIKNYSKYFNQMTFAGLQEGNDIYSLNQQSFADANNMYVDDGSLVSRDPLQEDYSLPQFIKNLIANDNELVEIINFEDLIIYVTIGSGRNQPSEIPIVSTDIITTISINGVNNDNILRLTNAKYKIATISHYIVVFNNNPGAKVFDINNSSLGWQNLVDLADIPIIETIVGDVTSTNNKNEFTSAYKKQYIWSNESHPLLPEGESGEVELNTRNEKISLTIPNTDILTDYRIVKKLNFTNSSFLISVVGLNIVLAHEDYFYFSTNGGTSFTRLDYPVHNGFKNIASLDKTGNTFFFVANDGVYYCPLGTNNWVHNNLTINGDSPKEQVCCFLSTEVYSFVTQSSNRNYVYAKGFGDSADEKETLKEYSVARAGDTYWAFDQLANDCPNSLSKLLNMAFNRGTNNAILVLMTPSIVGGALSKFNRTFTNYLLIETGSLQTSSTRNISETVAITVDEIDFDGNSLISFSGKCLKASGSVSDRLIRWYDYKYTQNDFTITINTDSYINIPTVELLVSGNLEDIETGPYLYPQKLTGGYITQTKVYDLSGNVKADLPVEVISDINIVTVDSDYFYLVKTNGDIWTNRLSDTDSATITYTYKDENDTFTQVPTLVYSDTEMFLAFNNILRITQNVYDGIDIKFNLPNINDQGFISSINAMLNVSTTEIALFFRDKITICSKVEDETFGYRYDYYNTRLSVGVRPGDSVINTLEGQYTVFPTRRGLAFMSYQQFVATTDQTLRYMSDNIENRWTKFYDEGQSIQIVQWRDYLVFRNGTKNILLLYLKDNSLSWWSWTIPIKVKSLQTDQVKLQLLSDTLYVFKPSDRYLDFPKTKRQKRIDWMLMSQPLHMNIPTHYKSIRQLIFQFIQTTTLKSSILAQVKLYRKKLTVRDSELISFRVEDFATFVKRFNYWKINEIQWALADDAETVTPSQLKLNGITIKYEIGTEVK